MRATALTIALLLLLPLAAQAQAAPPLASVEQTKQACSHVAGLLATGKADEAYASLLPYWPMPKEEIINLGYQTKSQLAMVGERFGQVLRAEHVATRSAGESLVRHTFLIKHANHALRLSCTFYKPDRTWLVNAVNWDDKPQALLELP